MSLPSILYQSEAAFAAVLSSGKTGTPLEPCHVYPGHSLDLAQTIRLPDITVVASQPVEISSGAGIFELKITFRLETQIDAETVSPSFDVHHARVQALRDFLENVNELLSRMNRPAVGLDTRTVPAFSLTALALESEQQDMADRILATELSYYLCASPS